jgi:hypothetical protein
LEIQNKSREKNKMKKNFSITLLVAMFSLLIIGFGATATAEAAGNCLEIAATDMMAVEFVTCLSDSAYQAANPELMASHRFVVADGSAPTGPVSDSAYLAANPELMAGYRFDVAGDSAPTGPVDIEFLQSVSLNPNIFHPGR